MQAGAFLCFLFLIGGASRLARFNISHDPKPRNPGRPDRKYFVGMPIPAAAGLLATTVHFFGGYPGNQWWVAIPWLCLVGIAGFLMVSTWRFWSGKEIDLSRSHPFRLLLVMAIVLYIMIRFSQGVAVRDCAGLHVFGDLGASGLWVVAPAAARAKGRLSRTPEIPIRTLCITPSHGLLHPMGRRLIAWKEFSCTRLRLLEPRRCWAKR